MAKILRNNNGQFLKGTKWPELVLDKKWCKECGNEIKKLYRISTDRWDKKVFCTKICYGKYIKKNPLVNNLKALLDYIKGHGPSAWKGDKVGYQGLHMWVRKELGTPGACEHCGKDGLVGRQIHWAHKTHDYKRESTNWIRLCAKCHFDYDRKMGVYTKFLLNG